MSKDVKQQAVVEADRVKQLHRIANAYTEILDAIGVVNQPGTAETPLRAAKMIMELTEGLNEDPATYLSKTFDENHDNMVAVCNIPLYSICEHHLLPFVGVAHVGYIPRKKGPGVVGLSKIPRLVHCFARRPQVQERLTSQIANTIQQHLDPQGVMVIVNAEHMCMTMRGVKVPGSVTVTSVVKGVFKNVPAAREEFMQCINQR